MSEFESAFLCGLLQKFEPKKILEVGVWAGGSTAIVMQCLEDIGCKYEMHSVEVLKECAGVPGKISGFAAEAVKNNLKCGEHQFYFGKILPQLIEEIGGDIDFLILDTMHQAPGEILDFIVALPYLTDNAVVVLHDVAEHQLDKAHTLFYATGALFSAVTADKIFNYMPSDSSNYGSRYSNIAAFQINSQTAKNIYNVFLSLMLRWSYVPSQDQFNAYDNFFRRNYSQDLYSIFIEAAKMNVYNLINRK